jgi:putative transcriptional regulator
VIAIVLEQPHIASHLECRAGSESMKLAGKLLMAMPGMQDPRFDTTVILVCAHSDDGAMGLIVNKTMSDLSFESLLSQLKIPTSLQAHDILVHFGGPVERGRGFVLHSSDYHRESATLSIEGGFSMTATLDVLEAMASGNGPTAVLLTLGYSGWGPGQLEAEILRNDWLIADASNEIIFATDDRTKWASALRQLGIEPLQLSGTSGHA